ncbi:MAG: hypothetical protein RLZZ221_2630 [Verrucomicrobiota bacterium]
MKPLRRFPLALVVPAFVPFVLAGCSLLPEPRPDPTRFYVLAGDAASAVTPVGPAVQVRAVEVAGYLRNRPMVVRRSGSEIEFREHARWGEPLEQGVARLLSSGLRARGVNIAPVGAGAPVLSVRVLACEGSSDGAVIFRAAWELTGGTSPAAGEFFAAGLRWDTKSEGSLATQLGAAVLSLADEVAAAALRKP